MHEIAELWIEYHRWVQEEFEKMLKSDDYLRIEEDIVNYYKRLSPEPIEKKLFGIKYKHYPRPSTSRVENIHEEIKWLEKCQTQRKEQFSQITFEGFMDWLRRKGNTKISLNRAKKVLKGRPNVVSVAGYYRKDGRYVPPSTRVRRKNRSKK
jgi:hypothetical protein